MNNAAARTLRNFTLSVGLCAMHVLAHPTSRGLRYGASFNAALAKP